MMNRTITRKIPQGIPTARHIWCAVCSSSIGNVVIMEAILEVMEHSSEQISIRYISIPCQYILAMLMCIHSGECSASLLDGSYVAFLRLLCLLLLLQLAARWLLCCCSSLFPLQAGLCCRCWCWRLVGDVIRWQGSGLNTRIS